MDITVENYQKKVRIDTSAVLTLTKIILKYLKVKDAALSIAFVSHQRIRALNIQYLGRNYATDVLAFDLHDSKSSVKSLMGDVIISVDAARKHIRQNTGILEEEIALYVIHGILHLLGYDDHSPADTKRMRKMEQEVLAYLGIKVKNILK